jgi:hypothetical protein
VNSTAITITAISITVSFGAIVDVAISAATSVATSWPLAGQFRRDAGGIAGCDACLLELPAAGPAA